MRPRSEVLAGEEGKRGGGVVGKGGDGMKGGTELRGFRGEKGASLEKEGCLSWSNTTRRPGGAGVFVVGWFCGLG